MEIHVTRIVYLMSSRMTEIESFCEDNEISFSEKIADDINQEIWIDYDAEVVDKLVRGGHLSEQGKEEIKKIFDNIGLESLVFY